MTHAPRLSPGWPSEMSLMLSRLMPLTADRQNSVVGWSKYISEGGSEDLATSEMSVVVRWSELAGAQMLLGLSLLTQN